MGGGWEHCPRKPDKEAGTAVHYPTKIKPSTPSHIYLFRRNQSQAPQLRKEARLFRHPLCQLCLPLEVRTPEKQQ